MYQTSFVGSSGKTVRLRGVWVFEDGERCVKITFLSTQDDYLYVGQTLPLEELADYLANADERFAAVA